MEFDQFATSLRKRLLEKLPGEEAHNMLRATPVGTVLPKFEHKLPPKPGSVLILLYPEQESILFPLIKRPNYPGAHSGQVSFPGGKAEKGEGIVDTALREAHEEIGINPNDVEVIGQLSNFFVIPSNFIVTPVIGIVREQPQLKPDNHEVVKILLGNLDKILRQDAVRTKEILAAGRYKMLAPHFEIENEVVWGATAMMLNEFKTVVNEIVTIR